MSQNMVDRGFRSKLVAPVWARHSCGAWCRKPDGETLSALLSEADWERGQRLIEFEAPDEACLLSVYSVWNIVLDTFIDAGGSSVSISQSTCDDLFDASAVRVADGKKPDDIQASLSFVDWAWVRSVAVIHPDA
jgi:hypothetical protein